MSDMKVLKESLIKLNIPFDKQFFNLPPSHYETLVEEIGLSKVKKHVRDVLIHYKNDKIISEKARKLSRLIDKKYSQEQTEQCECGFDPLGEEYDTCPCCEKDFSEGFCFYLNEDNSCAIDGQSCDCCENDCCEKL